MEMKLTKTQAKGVITFINGVERTIKKYGWIKHNNGNEKLGFCLLGACEYYNGPWFQKSLNVMGILLFEERGDGYIPAFNDWPGTKEGDIYKFLNRCRQLARKASNGKRKK